MPGVSISDLIQYAPMPENIKQRILQLLWSCAHPILADPMIFLLMLLITAFKDDSDEKISNIREQYWTMLRRYLQSREDLKMGVDFVLGVVNTCLQTLPIIAHPTKTF